MTTPTRWRVIDTILQAALACGPERRAAVVADACGEDEALRREVDSLLAAHADATGEFLERPAVELLGEPFARSLEEQVELPLLERLAHALEGRYVLDREIARGGMATVYLARDLRHDRLVAIKVLREELAAAVGAERFLAEIRVTASLRHPHILPLFDSGSTGGVLWYAMPFVDGETLRARLAREGPLPIADAMRLAREVADALDHAHARGIVHRDVKPENVLLQDGHALVADFGIALALEEAGGDRLTQTGFALGTPRYMAPEQAAGERAIDARVDIYALAAVLHEMLAGESPFAAPTRLAVVRRVMQELPPSLVACRPEVPTLVDAAVRRALSKRPDDRFPNVAAFVAALAGPGPVHDVAESGAVGGGGEPLVARREVMVRARTAIHVAMAMLVLGVAGGLLVARSSLVQRWTTRAPERVSVLQHDGPLATMADVSLAVVDRAGQPIRAIPAQRPWTPRFSPDGHRVAYGAFGAGRQTSDLWITDVDAGTTRRLTDDDADANDPQWSPDGATIAYSANASSGKNVMVRAIAGSSSRVLAPHDGTQFPSDWLRDGSALLVTDDRGNGQHDILVQPADGSAARAYVATGADETAARISPDGRWVAFTSTVSGRAEVYLDAYPRSQRRVKISFAGGVHPVWRGDGRELYYWRGDALVAVQLGVAAGAVPPAHVGESILFRSPYAAELNTMYDVSPDGKRFVIVRRL